jgi:hypothetical protein
LPAEPLAELPLLLERLVSRTRIWQDDDDWERDAMHWSPVIADGKGYACASGLDHLVVHLADGMSIRLISARENTGKGRE